MNRFYKTARGWFLALALPLPGCVLPGGAGSHAGERYVINAQRTQFYKYGPAQGTGPDSVLYKGQTLTMLGYAFGYSHVTTADGQSGYVATEDIIPAPPEPRPSPAPSSAAGVLSKKTTSSRNAKPAGRRPTRAEEAAVPLPELPERKPPPGAPGFRY